MRKVTTGCCALCQIDKVDNNTTKLQLRRIIDKLTKEKKANVETGISTGNGQTAFFVIVLPGEDILERNLIHLDFKHIHNFERRVGYPKTGDLKMYIKNL